MVEYTATQLVAHMIGDYLLQSDWMAQKKTRDCGAALAHVLTYSLPFFCLCAPTVGQILLIIGTHFLIDHYRLARYVCFAQNFIAPPAKWPKWEDCDSTGYHKDRPAWMAVWLLIIADNTLHVICNAIALSI